MLHYYFLLTKHKIRDSTGNAENDNWTPLRHFHEQRPRQKWRNICFSESYLWFFYLFFLVAEKLFIHGRCKSEPRYHFNFVKLLLFYFTCDWEFFILHDWLLDFTAPLLYSCYQLVSVSLYNLLSLFFSHLLITAILRFIRNSIPQGTVWLAHYYFSFHIKCILDWIQGPLMSGVIPF